MQREKGGEGFFRDQTFHLFMGQKIVSEKIESWEGEVSVTHIYGDTQRKFFEKRKVSSHK